MDYYMKTGDRVKGPYSLEMLQSSLRDGALKHTTLVRAEGEDEWVRIDSIAKLEAPAPVRRSAKGGANRTGKAQTSSDGDQRDRDHERGLDRDIQANMQRDKNRSDAFIGALICFAGIMVTIVSYSSASEGGGRYMVAWGAILFGGIRTVRGMMS